MEVTTLKLCPNCLTELRTKDRKCSICGKKINRFPIKRRTLLLLTSLVLLFAITVVCFIYFKNENSKARVIERFEKSIEQRNTLEVKKLVVHNDQSAISTKESQALIALIQKLGEVEVVELFTVVQTNPFFNTYSMQAPKISLDADDPNYNYKISHINTQKLIPGIYEIDITTLPDIDSTTKTYKLPILKSNTSLETEIPIIHFDFASLGIIYFPNAQVEINSKKHSLTDLINRSPLPIYLDEKFEYYYIIPTPWGEIKQKNFNESAANNFVSNKQFVSEKQEEQIITDAHEFLVDLLNNKMPTSPISEKVKNSMPTVNQDFSDTPFSTSLELETLTLNEHNEINGFMANSTLGYNKKESNFIFFFTYDKENKRFIIDQIFNDDFSINSSAFLPYFFDSISLNLKNLTQDELRASFYSTYKSILTNSGFFDGTETTKNSEEIETIKIDHVKLVNDNQVELDMNYLHDNQRINEKVILHYSNTTGWVIKK